MSTPNADHQRAWRDRQRGGPPRQLQPCGTAASYRRGCRCGACRSAWAEYLRTRRNPPTTTGTT